MCWTTGIIDTKGPVQVCIVGSAVVEIMCMHVTT